MASMVTAIRRVILLAVVGAVAYAIISWLRDRQDPPPPPPAQRAPSPIPVETSEPEPEAPVTAWVAPNDDGTAPASHPIKANADSGIYHVPGGASYGRTKAERCYATAAEAEADGFRASKR